MKLIKAKILNFSRQAQIGPLSPWLDGVLDDLIQNGTFPTDDEISNTKKSIVRYLLNYREETGKSKVILGMSGGVDSALTAALFKEADWDVTGVLMPIHQDEVETERGREACKALNLRQIEQDLSFMFDEMQASLGQWDKGLYHSDSKEAKIRNGNIRARLRMITLYNLAAANNGLVASTDNYSELAAGFWTLHGDVGDLAPIQSLYKSWEVPMMAMLSGVPSSIYRAKPTDGLGIDDGDEAQFGCSYLEFDIMLATLLQEDGFNVMHHPGNFAVANDERVKEVLAIVTERVKNTWFKRANPVNVPHPLFPERYADLKAIDRNFLPAVTKGE